jgi:hypothetical protein
MVVVAAVMGQEPKRADSRGQMAKEARRALKKFMN